MAARSEPARGRGRGVVFTIAAGARLRRRACASRVAVRPGSDGRLRRTAARRRGRALPARSRRGRGGRATCARASVAVGRCWRARRWRWPSVRSRRRPAWTWSSPSARAACCASSSEGGAAGERACGAQCATLLREGGLQVGRARGGGRPPGGGRAPEPGYREARGDAPRGERGAAERARLRRAAGAAAPVVGLRARGGRRGGRAGGRCSRRAGRAAGRARRWPRTRAPLQREPSRTRLRAAPRARSRCPKAAGTLPVVFRVRAGPAHVVARRAQSTRPVTLPAESAPQELRLRERPALPRWPTWRRDRRPPCSPPTATRGYLQARGHARGDVLRGSRGGPAWCCASTPGPRTTVDARRDRRARAHAGGGGAARAAGRGGRAPGPAEACSRASAAWRALGLFERVDHHRAGPRGRRPAQRSWWRREEAPAHHHRLRPRLRRARPPARERRGDAPQPVRDGPQPVHLRARQLPRQPAAGHLPRAVPVRPRSRSSSSPPSARRRTATSFDFIRYGGLLQTARVPRARLEPHPALHLPADAHLQHRGAASTRSDRQFQPTRPSPAPRLAGATTPATTPWTRARGHFLGADVAALACRPWAATAS